MVTLGSNISSSSRPPGSSGRYFSSSEVSAMIWSPLGDGGEEGLKLVVGRSCFEGLELGGVEAAAVVV